MGDKENGWMVGAEELGRSIDQKWVGLSRWLVAMQRVKGILTAGPVNGWRYWSENRTFAPVAHRTEKAEGKGRGD